MDLHYRSCVILILFVCFYIHFDSLIVQILHLLFNNLWEFMQSYALLIFQLDHYIFYDKPSILTDTIYIKPIKVCVRFLILILVSKPNYRKYSKWTYSLEQINCSFCISQMYFIYQFLQLIFLIIFPTWQFQHTKESHRSSFVRSIYTWIIMFKTCFWYLLGEIII